MQKIDFEKIDFKLSDSTRIELPLQSRIIYNRILQGTMAMV